jgi:hypothetical protein
MTPYCKKKKSPQRCKFSKLIRCGHSWVEIIKLDLYVEKFYNFCYTFKVDKKWFCVGGRNLGPKVC